VRLSRARPQGAYMLIRVAQQRVHPKSPRSARSELHSSLALGWEGIVSIVLRHAPPRASEPPREGRVGHDNNNTTERTREISKLTRAGHEVSHEVSHEVLCPI